MGVGKTPICLSLVLAAPPPMHLRVLPRESAGLCNESDFPGYKPLRPSGSKLTMSNATCVIVPMTLLSQWQREVQKFAPHLKVLVLHSTEKPTVSVIASSDIVLVSTFLLQNNVRGLFSRVKKIHWHRLVVDEAHMNNQKNNLAMLAANHRFSVTGTPIGSHLGEGLYAQVRFLRLAPFDRPAFWKNLIEEPFYGHSVDALRVLRSLLSRIVVRHSKSQSSETGLSILNLPPRKMETILLPFASDAERILSDFIEQKGRDHFLKLKKQSTDLVIVRFLVVSIDLTLRRVTTLTCDGFFSLLDKLAYTPVLYRCRMCMTATITSSVENAAEQVNGMKLQLPARNNKIAKESSAKRLSVPALQPKTA